MSIPQTCILNDTPGKSVVEYLAACKKYTGESVDRMRVVIADYIKHHQGKQLSDSDSIQPLLDLEKKWYKSLGSARPDYSVYADPYYFVEVWACWVTYSRKYLRNICSSGSLGSGSIKDDLCPVNSIMDLGCGPGYTTLALKQIFPDADVYGSNIRGTSQFKMAAALGKCNNFHIVGTYKNHSVDLVFASEYFEHIQNPVSHLIDVLKSCEPKYLLIANTFTSPAIGHFYSYTHDGGWYTGKQISSMFNEALKYYGYRKIKTGCWNGRPAYWKHKAA
jgi:SAM-dependent methyltransferase